MANKGSTYQVVGVHKDGKNIVSYTLQNMENDKTQNVDLEAFAFLVGQGRITNCSGQISNGSLIKRFNCDIKKIPILHINSGEITNIATDAKGKTAEEIMNQLNIVACIRSGRNIVAYILSNNGGAQSLIARKKVMALAQEGRIGNARHQYSNGESVLKGVNGLRLRDLKTLFLGDDDMIRNGDGVVIAKKHDILYL